MWQKYDDYIAKVTRLQLIKLSATSPVINRVARGNKKKPTTEKYICNINPEKQREKLALIFEKGSNIGAEYNRLGKSNAT